MNDEQILKLVKEHFDVGGIRDDGSFSEYYGNPDAFLKFAKAMYEKGNREGYAEGCIDTHISHKIIQST
jgi:hypothetical protein